MSEEKRELNLEELEKVAGGAGGTAENCPLGTHVLHSIKVLESVRSMLSNAAGCDVSVQECSICKYMVYFISGNEVSKETFYNSVKDRRHTEALLKTYFPGIKQ